MEEIKVGNFIRTPYHTIEKVVEIEKSKNKMYDDMVTTDKSCYGLNWLKRNGTKSSSDLISLVEEGDYVNGYICKRKPNFGNKMCNFDLNVMEWAPLDEIDIFYDIVTKEQFNRMKYIVGDESNVKN